MKMNKDENIDLFDIKEEEFEEFQIDEISQKLEAEASNNAMIDMSQQIDTLNEMINVLTEQGHKLISENKELKSTNEELRSEKTKLQNMLNRALELCERVKQSKIGRIFFRKQLRALPKGSEIEEINER